MDFYTVSYVESQIASGHTLGFVIFVVILLALLGVGIQAAELKLKLRTAGVQYVADVKRAVLEQNGQLSVVQFGEENIRFDLINDGQINQFTLDVIEKDKEWLEQEVQTQGYSIKDIYIAEYRDGKVVLYPYEKKLALN